MLELGCGDGGNALAIAQILPHCQVVGIDAARGPIEQGRDLAREAGLENVELHVGDLVELAEPGRLAEFDYIIAHGVYSWIPPRVRGALLECCRRSLAPHGVAFISYNAYPGSYLRDMARDILAYHLRGVDTPGERLARAHGLMETIVESETPTPYARVLREHLERMLAAGDALLYHDDLALVSTPFYFHEFIEHAVAHELQFLSEAQLADSQLREMPVSAGRLIAELPDDVVVREQYLDFFTNRMFRQTLLVHAGLVIRRELHDHHVEDLAAASPARWDGERFAIPDGPAMTTNDPAVTAAMHELGECWPGWLSFRELVNRIARRLGVDALPQEAELRLRGTLLEAYAARLILLASSRPPVVGHVPERPRASALARAQARAGRPVITTLLGENRALESGLERELLLCLDGQRDEAALVSQLGADRQAVATALQQLATDGLLAV